MGVMMQAFFWDCPAATDSEYAWWDHLRARVDELADAGIRALWLPPVSKGWPRRGMGYAPFDFFDVGDFDQQGGIPTWFGERAALESLLARLRQRGIAAYADVVFNHCSGGALEYDPIAKADRWTSFTVASERFPRSHEHFHPSTYERWDDHTFGDMPDLVHRHPYVYEHLLWYARFLVEELGFDGFRFDFVKGYGAWMVKACMEQLYQRQGGSLSPFGVAENWSSDRSIDDWLDEANRWSDNPVTAFDFPLRYRLKQLCDGHGYSLHHLIEPGVPSRDRPFEAVTFVDNHDFRDAEHPEIVNDKLLAYAYILCAEGYPCLYWRDWFTYGLGHAPHAGNLARLVAVHDAHAHGSTAWRWVDDNLLIMERSGWDHHSGLVLVLNTAPHWRGGWVDTHRPHHLWQPQAWWGHDPHAPLPSHAAGDGRAEFWAPPRGFAIYA